MSVLFAWLVIGILSPARSLDLRLIEYTTKNGTVCGPDLCRSFVHLVFTADGINLTDSGLVGGASYSLGGGPWQQGWDIAFERHLVHGICDHANSHCEHTASIQQMWNWGFEVVSPVSALPGAPLSICSSIWVLHPASRQEAELAAGCFPLGVQQVNTGHDFRMALNEFSSAYTSICQGDACRTNVHVVFTAAPTNPLAPLEGGLQLSWDGGQVWSSANTRTYYEQHIDLNRTDERWYQAWQADYDAMENRQGVREVCWAIWMSDTVTGETVWMDGAGKMRCMPICTTLQPFHNPTGYCPGASPARVLPVPGSEPRLT